MPDWIREAWRKLAGSKFSVSERNDVSRELAGYLDDLCSESRSTGADESSSTARAAHELHEDPRLGAHLYRARKEGNMNDRTKQLWLPGMTLMLATAATLALFQLAVHWTFGAYVSAPHPNKFPDLTFWSLRYRSAVLAIYFAWLYVLPFVSAAGAWWSRRAGSTRAMQVASGLFPLAVLLAVFLGQLAVAQGDSAAFLAINELPPAHILFMFLSRPRSLFLIWVAIPGAALLLGVLPFLWAGRTANEAARRVHSVISA